MTGLCAPFFLSQVLLLVALEIASRPFVLEKKASLPLLNSTSPPFFTEVKTKASIILRGSLSNCHFIKASGAAAAASVLS